MPDYQDSNLPMIQTIRSNGMAGMAFHTVKKDPICAKNHKNRTYLNKTLHIGQEGLNG